MSELNFLFLLIVSLLGAKIASSSEYNEARRYSSPNSARNPILSRISKPSPSQTLEQSQNTLVTGVNTFSYDLLKKLSAENKSVVFSPLSIAMALSMVLKGAKGNTEKEIKQTLHLQSMQNEDIHKVMKKVGFKLNFQSQYFFIFQSF